MTATALFSAKTHEPFLVDQLETQQWVRPGVEEKPRDAAVVAVVAPLRSRSFQLQQRAALQLLTPLPRATILTFRNTPEYFNVDSTVEDFSFFDLLPWISKKSSCFATRL